MSSADQLTVAKSADTCLPTWESHAARTHRRPLQHRVGRGNTWGASLLSADADIPHSNKSYVARQLSSQDDLTKSASQPMSGNQCTQIAGQSEPRQAVEVAAKARADEPSAHDAAAHWLPAGQSKSGHCQAASAGKAAASELNGGMHAPGGLHILRRQQATVIGASGIQHSQSS